MAPTTCVVGRSPLPGSQNLQSTATLLRTSSAGGGAFETSSVKSAGSAGLLLLLCLSHGLGSGVRHPPYYAVANDAKIRVHVN